MPADLRRALVLGGSGAVGREVVAGLAGAGVETVFTYREGRAVAADLAVADGVEGRRLDLRQPASVTDLIDGLAAAGRTPDVLVHCAAVLGPPGLADAADDAWRETLAVNAGSALAAARSLAGHLDGGADIVLVGALAPGGSLPLPVAFAASQGALSAMAMALAKELGPAGVRVNLVALGLLEAGIGTALDPSLREDYLAFSGLRRLGTTVEAARAIVWLALENRYMNGRTVAVNGGL